MKLDQLMAVATLLKVTPGKSVEGLLKASIHTGRGVAGVQTYNRANPFLQGGLSPAPPRLLA